MNGRTKSWRRPATQGQQRQGEPRSRGIEQGIARVYFERETKKWARKQGWWVSCSVNLSHRRRVKDTFTVQAVQTEIWFSVGGQGGICHKTEQLESKAVRKRQGMFKRKQGKQTDARGKYEQASTCTCTGVVAFLRLFVLLGGRFSFPSSRFLWPVLLWYGRNCHPLSHVYQPAPREV